MTIGPHPPSVALAVVVASVSLACRPSPAPAPAPVTPTPKPVATASEERPPPLERRQGCGDACRGWSQITFPWHEANVVAIAQAGATTVTVSRDNTLRFWDDAMKGVAVRSVEVGILRVLMDVSGDGKTLALLVGNELRWFDVASAHDVGAPQRVDDGAVAMSMLADGRTMVAFHSGKIELLGSGDVTELDVGTTITDAAVAPAGTIVAAIQKAEFGGIATIEPDAGAAPVELEAGSSAVPPMRGLAVDDAGTRVAAGGYSISVWSLETGTRLQDLGFAERRSERAAQFVAFSPDGAAVDFIANGSDLVRWSIDEPELLALPTPLERISAVTFTPTHVAAGDSRGGLVRVPRKAGGKPVRSPTVGAGVTALAFVPDTPILVGGTTDGHLFTWDVPEAREIERAEVHRGEINVVVSVDDRTVVTAGDDGARVVDIRDIGESRPLLDKVPVLAVAMCGDRTAVLGTGKGTVVWIALDDDEARASIDAHDVAVTGIDASADCTTAVSCAEDGTVKVWRRGEARAIHQFEATDRRQFQDVAFLAADVVVSAEAFLSNNKVRRWSLETGKELDAIAEVRYGISDLVVVGPTTVLGAALDKAAVLWDTDTDALAARFPAFDGNAMAVAASADGRYVALGTTGNEAMVRVWERD